MLPVLFDHLWQSTLVAAVVWLLTAALRKNRARVRHGLWLAASVKFLVPFSLFVALGSLVPKRAVQAAVRSNIVVTANQISQPFTAPAMVAMVPPAPSPLPAILFSVWACGFIGIACTWSVRWLRIRAEVRAGSPVNLNIPVEAMSSPTLLEPGVFGIFQPVLVLPEGIFDRLTPAQLQAVIAHELCHVRHRDNLIAALHMFVETVFWFHPLVWWIGKRMVEERERACDEEVLREFGEPRAYAEGILNACKLYAESPLRCMSGVTGADLTKRIEVIMSNRVGLRMSFAKRVALIVAGTVAVAVPIVIGMMNPPPIRAQSQPAPRLEFEVASIRPDKTDQPEMSWFRSTPSGAEFQGRSIQIKPIIEYAYGILDHQLAGDSSWLGSERFDIDAKPGSRKGQGWFEDEELRARVRTLLEERFHLRVHHESRQAPIYTLVTAKSGPKLKQAGEDAETLIRVNFGRGRAQIIGAKISMKMLAEAFARTLGRSVQDGTDLKGAFDVDLTWTPDESPRAGGDRPPPTEGPSLFTAVQEQLGLRLESSRGQIDMIVIDHVERPSEN